MPISADQKQALDSQAVSNFQEYLQIPSVHPNINYGKCYYVFLLLYSEFKGLTISVM